MDQAPDPEPAGTAPPDWMPWGAMLFVANISVFVLLARLLLGEYDTKFAGATMRTKVGAVLRRERLGREGD